MQLNTNAQALGARGHVPVTWFLAHQLSGFCVYFLCVGPRDATGRDTLGSGDPTTSLAALRHLAPISLLHSSGHDLRNNSSVFSCSGPQRSC